MNAFEVHGLLHKACEALDDEGDHAIAAYVGLALSLLVDKYGISTDDAENQADGAHAAHLPKPGAEGGGSWA